MSKEPCNRRYASGVCALVAILAICGVALGAGRPEKLVLTVTDLPTGFHQTRSAVYSNASAGKETGKLSPGRVTGWRAEYGRNDRISGLLSVSSQVDVYSTAGAASAFLNVENDIRNLRRFAKLAGSVTVSIRRQSVGRLGSESLFLVHAAQGQYAVDVYVLSWRFAETDAYVAGLGIADTFQSSQIVALAKKQQARIRRAAG